MTGLLRQFFAVFTVALWLLSPAFAQTLVIQYSDSHSQYDNINYFYRSVLSWCETFRKRHPNGTILIIANGDISGASLWAQRDAGEANHRVLTLLSQRYHLVNVLGNHDSFDFVGSVYESGMQPNTLVLRHGSHLVSNLGGKKILASNLTPTSAASHLYGRYQDIPLPSKEVLRVIGFITPNMIASSAYDTQSPLQLIERVNPLLETAKFELMEAASDGIKLVILAFHEELSFLQSVLEQLYLWKEREPKLQSMKILFAAAGHDHFVANEVIRNIPLIDAGANYAFSAISFDEKNQLQSVDHFDLKRQVTQSDLNEVSLNSLESDFLISLTSEVDSIRFENSRSYGKVAGTAQTKRDLELAQHELGYAISNSVRDWAKEVLEIEQHGLSLEGVVGFYNSTSYRNEKPISNGELLKSTTVEMAPFDAESKAFVMRGQDILNMFRSLRMLRERKKNYAPQISSNLREVSDYGLEILGVDGLWAPLREEAFYGIGMDYFLSRGGYRLPDFLAALSNAVYTAQTQLLTREILGRYLPRHLNCEFVLR